MRAGEFYLTEAGLSIPELKKPNSKSPNKELKLVTFINNVQNGLAFSTLAPDGMIDLDDVIIDPNSIKLDGQAIENVEELLAKHNADELTGTITFTSVKYPGITKLSQLAKTADFGGTIGNPNKGEMAEGVLGAAIFCKLLWPDKTINVNDIKWALNNHKDNKNGHGTWVVNTNDKTVGMVDRVDLETGQPVPDALQLTIRLKPPVAAGLYDTGPSGTFDTKMTSIAGSVATYVNDPSVHSYGDFFMKNGMPDSVAIISDGITGESETKTDVFLYYVTQDPDTGKELKRQMVPFDLSVKVAPIKQFGQETPGAQVSTWDERWDLQKGFWMKFGIDISQAEQGFKYDPSGKKRPSYTKKNKKGEVKPAGTMATNTGIQHTMKAYQHSYEEATKQFNDMLQHDTDSTFAGLVTERGFLKTLLHGPTGQGGINYFATNNVANVRMLDIQDRKSTSEYELLDFSKLDKRLAKVDLQAQFSIGGKDNNVPQVTIYDATDVDENADSAYKDIIGKQSELVTFRFFKSSAGRLNNLVEKEKLLIQLTKLKKEAGKITSKGPALGRERKEKDIS